jgi:hypothetical protein
MAGTCGMEGETREGAGKRRDVSIRMRCMVGGSRRPAVMYWQQAPASPSPPSPRPSAAPLPSALLRDAYCLIATTVATAVAIASATIPATAAALAIFVIAIAITTTSATAPAGAIATALSDFSSAR